MALTLDRAVRTKIMGELGSDGLNVENSIKVLLDFLDKDFKVNELTQAYENYINFERYKKCADETVTKFETLYNRCASDELKLPPAILGFKLLENSGFCSEDKKHILNEVNFQEKAKIFERMKEGMRKYLGAGTSQPASRTSGAIKVEPVFLSASTNTSQNQPSESSEETDVFFGSKNNYRGKPSTGYARKSYPRKRGAVSNRGRRTNPLDKDGNITRCNICESIFHYRQDCPDSYENMAAAAAAGNEQKVTLFLQEDEHFDEHLVVLEVEAVNSGVLDCGSPTNVAGKTWVETFIESLDEDQQKSVKFTDSTASYRFGPNSTVYKSMYKVTLPCKLVGKPVDISMDVVDCSIPLWFGKEATEKAGMILNTRSDC